MSYSYPKYSETRLVSINRIPTSSNISYLSTYLGTE